MIDYPTLKVIWWLLVGVLLVGFAISMGAFGVMANHAVKEVKQLFSSASLQSGAVSGAPETVARR